MSDLEQKFESASQEAMKLDKRPDNETLLRIYALYKQATRGDVAGKRPGFADITGRSKYDAWSKLKGMSSEEAMQAYVDLVEKLKK
jgi:acyl-CoA-binding protein